MKSIILYSSLTGNTKSVAEAMASVMPEGTPCVSVKDAPENLADYDTVFVGFWVDRGTANKEAAKLIETLKTSLEKTLDTANDQLKKLDAPLKTAENISNTVDEVNQTAKEAFMNVDWCVK